MQEWAGDAVATVSSGRVKGFRRSGVATFLGIPYAAAPIGPLRFQAPAPVAPWSGVREALVYGPTAPQPYRPSTLIPEPTIEGDDYLNLNVFAPDPASQRRPVLVWIHGGGFFAGCNVSRGIAASPLQKRALSSSRSAIASASKAFCRS